MVAFDTGTYGAEYRNWLPRLLLSPVELPKCLCSFSRGPRCVFSRMSQRLGAGLFCPESQSFLTYEPVLLGQGHHALFFLLDGFFPDDFSPRPCSLWRASSRLILHVLIWREPWGWLRFLSQRPLPGLSKHDLIRQISSSEWRKYMQWFKDFIHP